MLIAIYVVGVFCMDGIISLNPLNTFEKIGVQAQIFTIVNDEQFYYPDLIRGMIVDGKMGQDIAMYTGSTTGTSRSNEICSRYTPITWQVSGIYVSMFSLVRLFYFPCKYVIDVASCCFMRLARCRWTASAT